ncbi:hypothetical protein [Methylobacterium fujisawaense]
MVDAPPIWTVFSDAGQRSSPTLAALIAKRDPADAAAPPQDAEAIAAEARAEGRREGEALAARAAEAAAAAERAAAATTLAETRQRWVETEAAVLANGFAEQVQMLEARLAGSLTRVLQPFLAEALRQEAIRELQATVSSLVADSQTGTLTLSGPPDLVEALARRLNLPPGRLALSPDSRPDLRIQTNWTVIETRLQAWGDRIAALIEDR